MLSALIIIALITWVEFYALISKIVIKDSIKDKFLRFIYKAISLLYLTLLVWFILYIESYQINLKVYLLYSILVAILSDIGGLIFGRILKGKKLTKISPNKTIWGSIGSFIFSLSLILLFSEELKNYDFSTLVFITIIISLVSQLGDLFISFLKRKAKVKDTSNILPGHGGFLDRIDGIIFASPIGVILFIIL
tara:strand:- start:1441 stop:2019 length:579 start_codon:yes stop_codon:yes gene_type:complete